MPTQLQYLSDRALRQLRKDVPANTDRYLGGGFDDLRDEPGWNVPLGIEYDASLLATLDRSTPQNISSVDLNNSKVLGKALAKLTPSLANEERVWVRLAHVEAFEYCRTRWLFGTQPENVGKIVEKHFFASTQTAIRDDHALSRLWWNYYIANICDPTDVDGALNLILKTADIRSNFVERIWMTSRRQIARAVLHAMKADTWLTTTELNFRRFMKCLNQWGGGIVFEALSEAECNDFVTECVSRAKNSA